MLFRFSHSSIAPVLILEDGLRKLQTFITQYLRKSTPLYSCKPGIPNQVLTSAYIVEKIQGFEREIQGFGAEGAAGLTARRRRWFLGDDVAPENAISIENHTFT